MHEIIATAGVVVITRMMVFLISLVVVISSSYAVIITRPLVSSDTETTTTIKDNENNMINNQSQQQQFTQCIGNIMNQIQKGEINLDDPGLPLSQCFDQYFRGEKDKDNNNDLNSTLSNNLDLHSV